MIALMFDNIKVASVVEDRVILEDNMPLFCTPRDLFMGRDNISKYELALWLEDRVFPPDRVGAKRLLRKMGLSKYDPLEVALDTRACLVEDSWWIKVKETDTFEKTTIRGLMGHPLRDINDYR